jgi:hypothetical protein
MAKGTTHVAGHPVARGKKMKRGKAWRLVTPGGKAFKASLLKKVKVGAETLAIFRVLPKP